MIMSVEEYTRRILYHVRISEIYQSLPHLKDFVHFLVLFKCVEDCIRLLDPDLIAFLCSLPCLRKANSRVRDNLTNIQSLQVLIQKFIVEDGT